MTRLTNTDTQQHLGTIASCKIGNSNESKDEVVLSPETTLHKVCHFYLWFIWRSLKAAIITLHVYSCHSWWLLNALLVVPTHTLDFLISDWLHLYDVELSHWGASTLGNSSCPYKPAWKLGWCWAISLVCSESKLLTLFLMTHPLFWCHTHFEARAHTRYLLIKAQYTMSKSKASANRSILEWAKIVASSKSCQ